MVLDRKKKRARSEDEKARRKAAILAAARAIVGEEGVDGLTMAGLARRAGLAKGTLYLYVGTKEELLLALFVQAMTAIVVELETTATAKTLAEDLVRAAGAEPLFLPLFARLIAVIEANVDDTPLFCAKREIAGLSARMTALVARLCRVPPAQAGPAVSALTLAMQGAAQFDITARRDPATLPDDLKPVFAAHAFEEQFGPAARLILSTLA